MRDCPECGGSGIGVKSFVCDRCDGWGRVSEEEDFMREIKFRARRVSDRRWVYGTYAKHIGHFVIFDEKSGERHIIDPGTLGQYTGLKDKNGVGIFEGDIVQDEVGIKAEVRFIQQEAAFKFVIEKVNDPQTIYAAQALKCEVIGNIYENAELLK